MSRPEVASVKTICRTLDEGQNSSSSRRPRDIGDYSLGAAIETRKVTYADKTNKEFKVTNNMKQTVKLYQM